MLGTDFPYVLGDWMCVDKVEALPCSETEKQAILEGNARKLAETCRRAKSWADFRVSAFRSERLDRIQEGREVSPISTKVQVTSVEV